MNEELGRLWSVVAHVAQGRVEVLEAAVDALESRAGDRVARCALAVPGTAAGPAGEQRRAGARGGR